MQCGNLECEFSGLSVASDGPTAGHNGARSHPWMRPQSRLDLCWAAEPTGLGDSAIEIAGIVAEAAVVGVAAADAGHPESSGELAHTAEWFAARQISVAAEKFDATSSAAEK